MEYIVLVFVYCGRYLRNVNTTEFHIKNGLVVKWRYGDVLNHAFKNLMMSITSYTNASLGYNILQGSRCHSVSSSLSPLEQIRPGDWEGSRKF
jgi:hypothetical protein